MKKIHKTAVMEGEVELGDRVCISAFAVIRGDEGEISIGDGSNVQEHCTIHGKNVSVGSDVTVGHNAVLHGCRIGNNVLVGIHATVLDGAEIGEWCIVAAGAVVTPGTKVEPGSLVAGVPAKFIRKCTEEDRKLIRESAANYLRKPEKE